MKCRLFNFLIVIVLFSACTNKQQTNETPQDPQTSLAEKKRASNLSDEYVTQLYNNYHMEPKVQMQREENQIIDYIAEQGLVMEKSGSGLYYQFLEPGAGANLMFGDEVIVNYRGYFLDGTEFDSSYKRGKPSKFTIGQVIRGWNELLVRSRKGSKTKAIVPSHLGYGQQGFGDAIPPNKILIFELEVLDFTQRSGQ